MNGYKESLSSAGFYGSQLVVLRRPSGADRAGAGAEVRPSDRLVPQTNLPTTSFERITPTTPWPGKYILYFTKELGKLNVRC